MILRPPERLEAPPEVNKVLLPKWAIPAQYPARFKSAFGGRGAARSTTFARLITLHSLNWPDGVYACAREFQSSIARSSKQAVEKAIYQLGLRDRFKINKHDIVGRNGAYFFFPGIERNVDNIRGWEEVIVCWVEEAERLSHQSANVLVPTIRRPGSEIWSSWNPYDRGSWIYQRCIVDPRPGDVLMFANWRDNPWFPQELDDERRAVKRQDPDLYLHIWEGQPYDEGAEKRFLPYALLNECVDAWHLRPKEVGRGDVGFDIADTGVDKNAAVYRLGPCIMDAKEWREKTVTRSTLRAHIMAWINNARVCSYDRTAVGAEARRTFADLASGTVFKKELLSLVDVLITHKQYEELISLRGRPYRVVPEQFGAAVRNPKRRYSFRTTNEDMFLRRNSQMGWALRLRANNTRRLLHGEKIDPNVCLFINPKIPNLTKYLAQLSQPKWDETQTGRIQTLKKEEGDPSPDLFDATSLAFSQDSRHGLKAD